MADLARVRKALVLLSDDDAPAEVDAEADTNPIPVILPDATAAAHPAALEVQRGPFEPRLPRTSNGVAASAEAGSTAPEAPRSTAPAAPRSTAREAPGGTAPEALGSTATAEPPPAEPVDSLPPAAAEALDQIKDLLITAEAIGEANLDVHFEQVSQRQRELIREFFDQAIPDQDPRT